MRTDEFGTPYAAMLDDLLAKDPELYDRLGLITMLERNVLVKTAPEKFQAEEVRNTRTIFFNR